MNEEQETETTPRLQKWAAGKLLLLITACPHILRPETNIEMLVEELNKAAIKVNKYSTGIIEAMDELLPFITICPHIFKPEIGIEAFIDELSKASSKFDLYFHVRQNNEC